jgi:group I intron endonuclease
MPSGKFYIGRTKQNFEKRIKQHLQQTKSKSIISSLLKKYSKEEFRFEIVDGIIGEINLINLERLTQMEQTYIDKYFEDLLCINLSKSSRGPIDLSNRISNQSKEQKELFRRNYQIWWDNKTPEQDRQRRERLKISHEAKLIPIDMFDLENNYIGRYKSKRDIIRNHPQLHRRGIQKVLNNEYSQHKGYIFVYIKSK